MYTSTYKSTKLLRNSFQIATDREMMGEIEDSFVAIGPSEIGFWAGGAMARCKIGALFGIRIGCVGIVGREKILLNNEIKGFYGLSRRKRRGRRCKGCIIRRQSRRLWCKWRAY